MENIAKSIIDKLETLDPSKLILQCDRERLTVGQFLEAVSKKTQEYLSLGIKPQQYIFIKTERGLCYWVDVISVLCLGAIMIPIDAMMQHEAYNHLTQVVTPHFIMDGRNNPADINNLPAPSVPFETAAILFTSGSTGTPKGVVLSHKALLGNARAVLEQIQLTENDILGITTAFHFTTSLCNFLAAMLVGATLNMTERKLMMSDFTKHLNEQNITCFSGSPVHIKWMLEAQAFPTLKWVMCSGDYLNKPVLNHFITRFPHIVLHVVYGLTEVAGRLCFLHPNYLQTHRGSVGKPMSSMVISVHREDNKRCEPNEIGEIWVTGPYLAWGYFNKETFNGVFRTGDLGYLDEMGFLYLMGRRDNVFKCAGKKISGYLITDTLLKTDLFKDIAVIPYPDEIFGHIPYVLFTLKENCHFNKGQLLSFLRAQLPPNHLPRKFIETVIPRTSSGKLKYKECLQIVID